MMSTKTCYSCSKNDKYTAHNAYASYMHNIEVSNNSLLIIDHSKNLCCKCGGVLPVYYSYEPLKITTLNNELLPFKLFHFDFKIYYKIYLEVCEEKRFGQFLYSSISKFVIYFPCGGLLNLVKPDVTLNGIKIACCKASENKIIIIDENGQIIKFEFIRDYSDNYNGENFTLIYVIENDTWTYINHSGQYTKPAIRDTTDEE